MSNRFAIIRMRQFSNLSNNETPNNQNYSFLNKEHKYFLERSKKNYTYLDASCCDKRDTHIDHSNNHMKNDNNADFCST